MYNDFFHFRELPFSIAPDPHFMFMSTRHQEGLAHLLYGINHGGGFVALTGEVGTGKTTLCNCLLQQLPENINIALILNPKLNALELLETLCDELRVKYDSHRQSLKYLVDTLNQYLLAAHASNRRTVLIIDEAQNLNLEVLEQVRLLTNLETSKTKLLQIILVGQPELNELLNRRELRQLNQRITARYHLLPLSMDETRFYIRHRLAVCKGDPELFKESAIKEIFNYSKGIPRVINIICHTALLGAYSVESRVITPRMVKRAADETLGKINAKPNQIKPLLILLALIGIGGIMYHQKFLVVEQSVPPSKTILSGKLQGRAAVRPAVSVKIPPQTQVKSLQFTETRPFNAWIDNPGFTLDAALGHALKLWDKAGVKGQYKDCQHVQEVGLLCLFDKGNWKELRTFNRPAIMEFSLPNGVKRFVLLAGIKDDRPVFRHGQDSAFPLSDVLSLWDGYYLILWQLPRKGLTMIYPGQSSEDVAWLREQLMRVDGLDPVTRNRNYFDGDLKRRVINFQKNMHLTPDGKVGMQTIFHLDVATGAEKSPHLKD